MRTILRISLVLNLVLLGALAFKVVASRKLGSEIMAAPRLQPLALTISHLPGTQEKVEPLQWRRLFDTNDYRIYVNNLRNIGCPEPTVRDIVSGDANRAFSYKRKQLSLAGRGPGLWSEQAEARLVASLLGETSGSDMAQTSTSKQSRQQNVEAAAYPLVFQNVDLDALGLNEDQKAAVAAMRQHFIEAIGGPNQDPNDPAYQARWQNAQPEMDDMMRGMLGVAAFENYQLASQENNPDPAAGNP